MSFDISIWLNSMRNSSQSLWNRAMSFDLPKSVKLPACLRLNPFGTGQCLSTCVYFINTVTRHLSQSLWNRAMSFDSNRCPSITLTHVSIPLEQGNVFRHNILLKKDIIFRLNPFGTGQCLSTQE